MSPPIGMSSLSMSAVEETSLSDPVVASPPPTTKNTSKATTTKASNNSSSMVIAKQVSATQQSLNQCGERLRAGELVSFPTETVYGLGCHALDPIAVQKVFDAKERPLSDPLIVHVTRSEDALELWAASSSMEVFAAASSSSDETIENNAMQQQKQLQIEKQALSALTQSFFPGPLTLVARAHPSIPQILMADTGYVACRSPSHPVARALIAAAECPIAAPSANKFGHVSPTMARHVMDDLGREDVWVVDPSLGMLDVEDGDDDVSSSSSGGGVCEVGVESTVAKIEMNANSASSSSPSPSADDGIMGSITVLRHGAISSQSIRTALEKANLSLYFDVSDSVKFTSEKVYNVAPGQTVKHYSPNVPCFMISASRQHQEQQQQQHQEQQQQQRIQSKKKNEGQNVLDVINEEERTILSQSVIIDYGKRLLHYQPHALAYRDLSPECNPSKAASNVFETLRWSETVEGAIRVFVPELVLGNNNYNNDDEKCEDDEGSAREKEEGALVLAVKDKLTRAASAMVVNGFQ